MLNKYIEFLKRLTESVFDIKGVCNVKDYFEAVWRGFLLLFVIVLTLACIVAVIVGPFLFWKWVWKKLTVKYTEGIKRLWKEQIENGQTDTNYKQMCVLEDKLTKVKKWYIVALSVLHLPFIIPLIMVLVDFIL